MKYRLIQLAPGSQDLLVGEVTVACAVKSPSRKAATWTAELLDGKPDVQRPEPATMTGHEFASFGVLCAWLGDPEIQTTRRYSPIL